MGPTSYEDDTSIRDSDDLWRRIFPKWIVPDKNTGGTRLSSQAFEDSRDGTPMSVVLADIVKASGRVVDDLLTSFGLAYGMASITAGLARGCSQKVCRAPVPEEEAHAYVVGKKTKSVKNRLVDGAVWLVDPRPRAGTGAAN